MTPELIYEHSDIPPGMSCAEYRRRLADRTQRHRARRVLRRLRTTRTAGPQARHA